MSGDQQLNQMKNFPKFLNKLEKIFHLVYLLVFPHEWRPTNKPNEKFSRVYLKTLETLSTYEKQFQGQFAIEMIQKIMQQIFSSIDLQRTNWKY